LAEKHARLGPVFPGAGWFFQQADKLLFCIKIANWRYHHGIVPQAESGEWIEQFLFDEAGVGPSTGFKWTRDYRSEGCKIFVC
jgi:hypothetical protein